MSEDSNYHRDQKKKEENGIVPDFSGSLGKGMLAKEKIELLENSSGLTPLSFGAMFITRIWIEKTTNRNELKRTR